MRRILGKGLSQLIGEQFDAGVTEAPIESISPNARQPRVAFPEESLRELAASIAQVGVIQPLLVKALGESTYELIAGERRLRAAKMAGLATVPVIIRSADGQRSLELALIENVQREDINALEAARAYRRLIDEFEFTQEQVADRVGKSRTTVTNTMRLLKLPRRIQDGLAEGRVSEGHARALLAFPNEAQQLAVYDRILENGLSVRDVEKASKATPELSADRPVQRIGDPNLLALEDAVAARLGAPVRIGKGKITIEYFSDDDLQRILDLLDIAM